MRKRHEVPRRSPRLREFVAPPRAAGQHRGGCPGAAPFGQPLAFDASPVAQRRVGRQKAAILPSQRPLQVVSLHAAPGLGAERLD